MVITRWKSILKKSNREKIDRLETKLNEAESENEELVKERKILKEKIEELETNINDLENDVKKVMKKLLDEISQEFNDLESFVRRYDSDSFPVYVLKIFRDMIEETLFEWPLESGKKHPHQRKGDP